jgi:hypothetical protein
MIQFGQNGFCYWLEISIQGLEGTSMNEAFEKILRSYVWNKIRPSKSFHLLSLILIPFMISIFSLFCTPAFATTFYVDATNGKDINDGLSPSSPWKTIAKVNASKFNPGDQILFKRGETWREQLTVPSSGSSGNPITFGAYGSGALPVINGSNLLSSGWTQYSSTVWQTAVTTRPNQIFFKGVRGTPVASVAAINAASKWYWAANVLYAYSTSNPAMAFTSPGIEATALPYNIETNGKSYLTIQNLNLQNSNIHGLVIHIGNATNLIMDGLTVGHSYYTGISTGGAVSRQYVTIQNCTINWCGACGINIDGASLDILIQNNIIHNNSQISIDDSGIFSYNGGIKAWSGSDSIKRLVIQGNHVYSQGKLPDGSSAVSAQRGQGIWVDTLINTNYTDGVFILRNEVYDNMHNGILAESPSYVTIAYNLVYNHTRDSAWGIRASDWYALNPANYNRIYNNVVYGNSYGGIIVAGSKGLEANRCVGNEVKNNISVGNGAAPNALQLVAEYGGENDGSMGSLNVYLNNAFGPAASHFIQWGHATNKNTYAAWYSAYSAANGNTVEGDPLFVSTVTPDFHLQSTSPAINAGTNVGLTSDNEGNHVPFGPAPDIGAYEYHSGFLKRQPPTGLRIAP